MLEQRNLQRLNGLQRGIRQLRLSRGHKKTKGGFVAQSVVDSEARRHPPGILRIQSQALHVLREAAVARRRAAALRSSVTAKAAVGVQLRSTANCAGLVEIEGWILREDSEVLGRCRQGAAHHRLMDEVHAKLQTSANQRNG